jgi:putative endonuclease
VRAPSARQALGGAGEALAAAWYEANGYEILARNWRCRQGELDLIACKPGPRSTLVFCEVKTRSSLAFGSPQEAVTRTKRDRIRRLAAQWLATSAPRQPGRAEIRFDVAAVLDGEIQLIENAF